MCGILGWLEKDNIQHISRFKSSLSTLKHRGPDANGLWHNQDVLLGHQRLSIIDLTKNGHQPMIENKSGSTIIFNGEIYNYLEIGQELKNLGYVFNGSSDTEVLLYSLIEWGPKIISRLNGMWSFAFWSPKKKQLILSRDRFGVKPLYYNLTEKSFSFASEPKALTNLFVELKKIDEDSLTDFLKNNSLYTKNDTFYKNIKVFPKAHYALYEPNKNKLEFFKYWDYPTKINYGLKENEAIEEFSILLKDAVKIRLRSDVNVGITLSGGLDSTGILASIKDNKKPIHCFTSKYKKDIYDEFKWAKIASDNANTILTPVLTKEENWFETLKKISWHMDAPGYSPAVIPMWNIMKCSKNNNVSVLLDGQGADELLGGYKNYMVKNFLLQSRNNRNIKFMIAEFNGLIKTFGALNTFNSLIGEIFPDVKSWYLKKNGSESILLKKYNNINSEKIKKNRNKLIRDYLINDHSTEILPGLLHYGDTISMANGIELRNPFLDYRLVEWVFQLPDHLLFNNNETKSLLRQFLRKNKFIKIANRNRKIGYSTPINKWLLDKDVESFLLSNDNPMFQWCDKKNIQKLIHLNKRGLKNAGFNLYKFLSSQLWIQECIEKK